MTVSALKKKLVLQAVQVLRDINKQYYDDSSKKKPLLEDEEKNTLYLQVTLKKIPKSRSIKMIKVNLPHSLVKDNDEVCLITGDLDKKDRKAEIEPDVLHYKALLNRQGVTHITEVVTLRQLRTEYKPYEAKQKLLAAYDMFLADNKITECLPRVLGKHFFKKRKFPIQINLKTSNLKQQVEKALSTKVFYITGKGNSCTSEVAYLDMDESEILENVMAMAEVLSKNVPGTWCNVMGIYLKTARSKAVPVYMSYDSPNDVQLQEEKEENDVEIDELSTLPNIRVKVYSDGKVETESIEEVLETPFAEMDETDTVESNVDSILQGLENEDNDMQMFETETTKQVESEKETKSAKNKKKNMNEVLVSPNHSQKKSAQQVKPEKETKSVKQKKKNIKQESVFPDQSLEKTAQQVKPEKETKSVKQKKKNIKQESVFPDQSLEKTAQQVKPEKETKSVKQKKKIIKQESVIPDQSLEKIESNEGNKKAGLKRKRVKRESNILDSEQSVKDNETPMQLKKKRKVEGINMKRHQSMKESQKNKRKKNQSRTKQRI